MNNIPHNPLASFLVACGLLAPFAGALAQDHPAQLVAGKWMADVRMSAPAGGEDNKGYWWVGRMWGAISDKGAVIFKADNNCLFEGVLTVSSVLGIEGKVKAKDCNEPVMNRTYSIKFNPTDKLLKMALNHTIYTPAISSYDIVGTFVRY